MRNKKIVFGILIVLMSLLITGLFYSDRIISSFLFADLYPREPKNQIEVVNDIGWWANQKELRIVDFSVKVIESKLNLFNAFSLISYTIKGELKGNNNWRPFIGNVHASERFIRIYNRELHPYLDKDTAKIPEAMIEITPVVRTKEDKNYKGESVMFQFTNELKLESFHFGNNWIRFQCDSLERDLILQQFK